ncbi:CIA30 family protein [Jhaorihella thermophila]|uniref:CIA30 family protein n=1 Tax=Jhaorihella thermophila TaxID=488547 RepID=UPI003620A7F7
MPASDRAGQHREKRRFHPGTAHARAPSPGNGPGLELEVRGNDQTYYVHLRGRGPSLPWQFHQAPFEAAADLRVVRIPFDAFRPRGMILGRPIAPERIRSIAVVAYGRDHEADLAVRRLGWY